MTGTALVQAMLRIKYHPALVGTPTIGGDGYAMPQLDQPIVLAAVPENRDALLARGITMEGEGGVGSVIVLDESLPMLDVRCRFRGHADCAVILGQGAGFSGDLNFGGPHGLFVSAGFGNMGGPSRIAVTLNASCVAYFGRGVTSVDSRWLAEGEDATPCAIVVGDDAMISWGVWCRNYDSHGVFDIETLSVINTPGNILVGPHVWLGQDAKIARGVQIGAGSLIGMGAIVASDIPDRAAAAGVPARVVRKGVTWYRGRNPSEAQMKAIVAAL